MIIHFKLGAFTTIIVSLMEISLDVYMLFYVHFENLAFIKINQLVPTPTVTRDPRPQGHIQDNCDILMPGIW